MYICSEGLTDGGNSVRSQVAGFRQLARVLCSDVFLAHSNKGHREIRGKRAKRSPYRFSSPPHTVLGSQLARLEDDACDGEEVVCEGSWGSGLAGRWLCERRTRFGGLCGAGARGA